MASLANITPALTTTFVPKATTCTENRLTMLANRGFQIWMNEPLPVSGSIFSDCYPSQFMQSYTLLGAKVTQPAFNPLVCPQNYETIGPYTSNYIACCPSGYKLADPTANPFSDRPAFGGTCYTPIEMATPVLVTAYGSSGPTATITFSATATNAQAYAHPFEGFAFGVAQVQSVIPSATTTGSNSTPSSSSAPATYIVKAGSSGGLSSKAKLGIGLGIGIPALLLSIFVLRLVFFRKRRSSSSDEMSLGGKWETSPTTEYYHSDSKDVEEKPQVPPKGQEVHGNSVRIELPAYQPVELDAGGGRGE